MGPEFCAIQPARKAGPHVAYGLVTATQDPALALNSRGQVIGNKGTESVLTPFPKPCVAGSIPAGATEWAARARPDRDRPAPMVRASSPRSSVTPELGLFGDVVGSYPRFALPGLAE